MTLTNDDIQAIVDALAIRLEQPQPIEVKRYMRVEQTAEYLGVSIALLNKLRSAGKTKKKTTLPFVKLGEAVLYDRNDVDAWLERNKQVMS